MFCTWYVSKIIYIESNWKSKWIESLWVRIKSNREICQNPSNKQSHNWFLDYQFLLFVFLWSVTVSSYICCMKRVDQQLGILFVWNNHILSFFRSQLIMLGSSVLGVCLGIFIYIYECMYALAVITVITSLHDTCNPAFMSFRSLLKCPISHALVQASQ